MTQFGPPLETPRMQAVQSPIIPVVGELIRRHPGTISLGQGVVFYGPPPTAISRITDFLANPDNHKYQAAQGIADLREQVGAKLQTENGILLNDRAQIVITPGSNLAFVNALLAIASPGDEIIFLTPYYFNHEMAVAIASCRAVLVPTDAHYQPQIEAIIAAITPKTRAIVTISPNNPSGAVYPEATLRAINQLCRDRGIYHISDEAYEYFTWGETPHFSPAAIADSQDYTISLFSLSKAYGFASWRIGYMVIPAHLLSAVMKIQDTIAICPPVISQHAAIGALQAGRGYCQDKLVTIGQVREQVLTQLDKIRHFCTLPTAEGAFYCLLRIDTPLDAMTVTERLIREHGVAVIPGTTFGLENACYLRVAYGVLQPETAQVGMERLVKGLRAIVGDSA